MAVVKALRLNKIEPVQLVVERQRCCERRWQISAAASDAGRSVRLLASLAGLHPLWRRAAVLAGDRRTGSEYAGIQRRARSDGGGQRRRTTLARMPGQSAPPGDRVRPWLMMWICAILLYIYRFSVAGQPQPQPQTFEPVVSPLMTSNYQQPGVWLLSAW